MKFGIINLSVSPDRVSSWHNTRHQAEEAIKDTARFQEPSRFAIINVESVYRFVSGEFEVLHYY